MRGAGRARALEQALGDVGERIQALQAVVGNADFGGECVQCFILGNADPSAKARPSMAGVFEFGAELFRRRAAIRGRRCLSTKFRDVVAMRGRDEETGEFRGASRSQQRREALEIFDLGEKLVALTPAQLAKLPVPESLIPHIEESKRITSHIAHKRQLAFLAKHMRREDEQTLAAIRDAWTPTATPRAAKWRRSTGSNAGANACSPKATWRCPNCWKPTRPPTASNCVSWCATRSTNAPKTSLRARTANCSRYCASCRRSRDWRVGIRDWTTSRIWKTKNRSWRPQSWSRSTGDSAAVNRGNQRPPSATRTGGT
ncbi:hypothetical protein XAP6164_4150011 [Xanthomonas phaseoli pv. phaseoli]|nr:hypothetical protein XAP6164_4150011 [Xanthomonas phaseoli pv. phaseoli]